MFYINFFFKKVKNDIGHILAQILLPYKVLYSNQAPMNTLGRMFRKNVDTTPADIANIS